MVFNATFNNISYGGSILFFIGRYHKSALSQRLALPITIFMKSIKSRKGPVGSMS